LDQKAEGCAFFKQFGFVIWKDVMSENENESLLRDLVDDIHEINPNTKHKTDVADFDDAELPTTPNRAFRSTCNIVFGRFATTIRNHEGVRQGFAHLHGVPTEQLGCSWDTVFYTPKAKGVAPSDATQLHWDANGYNAGKKHLLADELCCQGVYYASKTNLQTPTFVASPGSHKVFKTFTESDQNPAKKGETFINYMPLVRFEDNWPADLPLPVRIHVPARSLLLWNSWTLHGNAPGMCFDTDSAEALRVGRVSMAVCMTPVDMRTPEVQKDALVKAIGGVRTTHHPTTMKTHDQQGYPVDWTAAAEYEPKHVQWGGPLRDLAIQLNPEVTAAEFQQMIERSTMSEQVKSHMISSLSLQNLQNMVYNSYWKLGGLRQRDYYDPMHELSMKDLRRLMHPKYSHAQGYHPAELVSD